MNLLYIEVVIQKCQVLRDDNQFDEALSVCQNWIERWRPLLGEAHPHILELYGILGEVMLSGGYEGEEEAIHYLVKYAQLSEKAAQVAMALSEANARNKMHQQ